MSSKAWDGRGYGWLRGVHRLSESGSRRLGWPGPRLQRAFEISQLQYRQGAGDLLAVLQAQQTLFAAEDELAQITLAHRQAVVHLYEALGGGWLEDPSDRTQVAQRSSGAASGIDAGHLPKE